MASSSSYRVLERFQRATRLDTDLNDARSLDGYVLSASGWETIRRVLTNSKSSPPQRAFTWTGPYGSGKSSLALLLAALLSPKRRMRNKALETLGSRRAVELRRTVTIASNGWIVVPLVARSEDLAPQLRTSLLRAATEKWGPRRAARLIGDNDDVVDSAIRIAEAASRTRMRFTTHCG
jgi:energy-coupling factor transporter ATP-binding protein EcfA2